MKKGMLLLLILSNSIFISSEQYEHDIAEVKLDNKLETIITSFIEYTRECLYDDYYYPKDNILSLCLENMQTTSKENVEKELCIYFYPDEIGEHEYSNPIYISHLNINDSIYNVYVILCEELISEWENYQNIDVFIPTGKNTTITQTTDYALFEYDPPYLKMWRIDSSFTKRKGYYVTWEVPHYCW